MTESKVDVLADGTTSMYWAGRAAYQSGLTLAANPWDGDNPSEARANWSWRKGFAGAERDALAACTPAKSEESL